MGMEFSITCKHCSTPFPFTEAEADGLADHIIDERCDARRESEKLYVGPDYIDASELSDGLSGNRPLRELAVAIRRGDRAEAEHLLDVIAAKIGDEATEQVQQGRFSPEAKRAA